MGAKKQLKKLHESIEAYGEAKYQQGWHDGWDSAEANLTLDAYEEGIQVERDRINAIFDMNIQWALESNKGSDVVFFTKAKQIIEPIEVDFSPEAYQRELEKDGF